MSAAGVALRDLVECPACKGRGSFAEPVGLTSNPRATCDVEVYDCGFCAGSGRVPKKKVEEILDEIENPRRYR